MIFSSPPKAASLGGGEADPKIGPGVRWTTAFYALARNFSFRKILGKCRVREVISP